MAGTKTVLVGDPRQLAPVKARGGMFAQLAADLPWAQQLSQVWRMRDPAERAASLAVRDGDDTALAGAAQWYREHQRLHTGDPVTMAADALAAWTADGAGGVDSLLIADRWEIADALNERLHRTRVDQDAPTVGGARRAAIGVGDIVISRRNDAAIPVFAAEGSTPIVDAPVRNGQRWLIERVDVDGGRVLARRLGDRARVVFEGDYLRRHVHHGYAVTVHAAQGATADRCHAVLSVTGTRSAAYVAMTRGRDTNCVYLYERIAGEGDHEHADTPTVGVAEGRRGDPAEASAALLNLLGRDDTTRTVTATAAVTDRCALPAEVVALLELREQALNRAARITTPNADAAGPPPRSIRRYWSSAPTLLRRQPKCWPPRVSAALLSATGRHQRRRWPVWMNRPARRCAGSRSATRPCSRCRSTAPPISRPWCGRSPPRPTSTTDIRYWPCRAAPLPLTAPPPTPTAT